MMNLLDRPMPPSEAIKHFLDDADWGWGQNQRPELLHTHFRGISGNFACTAVCLDPDHTLIFYCLGPQLCPPERRAVMAEFLTRANWGLHLGAFELDLDDGEVRFRASTRQRHGIAPNEAGELAYAACQLMDRYLPGISAIMNVDASAEEALALVE